MKVFLFGLALVTSLSLANPIPLGTPQYGAAEEVIASIDGYTFTCPDKGYPDYVQTLCGGSDGELNTVRGLVDAALLDYAAFTDWQTQEDGSYVRVFDVTREGKIAVTIIPAGELGTGFEILYGELADF